MKPETLGVRIQQARKAMGLSVRQLAMRMSVKPSSVEKWEQGQTQPRANKLLMLAGVLGVPVLWLLDGEGDPGAGQEVRFLHTSVAAHKLERALAMQSELAALLLEVSADLARLQRSLDGASEEAEQEPRSAA